MRTFKEGIAYFWLQFGNVVASDAKTLPNWSQKYAIPPLKVRIWRPKSVRNRKVGTLGRFVKSGATLKMKNLEKPEIGKNDRENGSYLEANRISSAIPV